MRGGIIITRAIGNFLFAKEAKTTVVVQGGLGPASAGLSSQASVIGP